MTGAEDHLFHLSIVATDPMVHIPVALWMPNPVGFL